MDGTGHHGTAHRGHARHRRRDTGYRPRACLPVRSLGRGKYAAFLVNRGIGPWRAAALHGGYGPPDQYRPTPEAPPLRLYLGERDHIFSVEGAQAAAAALAAAGHDTELHLIPDHTHWFYEIGPNLAADAWGWFNRLDDPS